MVRVGIDLVEISRIKRVRERCGDRFLERVFSPPERRFLARKKNPYPSMAARFAAKEAAFKALDLKGRGSSWQDVVILSLRGGKPTLLLSGAASRRARELEVTGISVSLTHSRDTAAAFVCLDVKK